MSRRRISPSLIRGLGRAHRKVEHRGDLRVRVALEVGELQRFSLDLGQGAQRLSDPSCLHRGMCCLGGRVVLDGLAALVVRRVPSRARLRGPDPVHGLAVHERQDPGDGAPASRVEPARGPPDLQEGLLCDLLGLARVADDPHRQPVGTGRRRVVQLGEGCLVPAPRALEQLGEVGRRRRGTLQHPGWGVGVVSADRRHEETFSQICPSGTSRGSDSESGPDRIGDPGKFRRSYPGVDLRLLECARRGKMVPWPATQ